MKKLIGFIYTGLYSAKIWKDFNYLRTLEVELEWSDGEVERVAVYDLKKKLKALDVRELELKDAGLITILLD